MEAKTINKFPIREYLAGMGIHPVKDRGYYGMYYSPFREDHNASMKVDFEKNLWIDYGTSDGGTLIDLVMKMENLTFPETANRLAGKYADVQISNHANNTFSFHGNNPSIKIQHIMPIKHPKLIEWVQERKIALDLAKQYCVEIHYQTGNSNYFSVGFRNDSGGYELNSPNFKGCFPPKDIKTLRNNDDTCLVFEGFWDFLSYLTLKIIDKTKHDATILNSVANVQKAMAFLKKHRAIRTYLDNDAAGQKATELIQSAHPNVCNYSTKYSEYKDLNEYLCNKKMLSAQRVRRGFKL